MGEGGAFNIRGKGFLWKRSLDVLHIVDHAEYERSSSLLLGKTPSPKPGKNAVGVVSGYQHQVYKPPQNPPLYVLLLHGASAFNLLNRIKREPWECKVSVVRSPSLESRKPQFTLPSYEDTISHKNVQQAFHECVKDGPWLMLSCWGEILVPFGIQACLDC